MRQRLSHCDARGLHGPWEGSADAPSAERMPCTAMSEVEVVAKHLHRALFFQEL